MKLIAISQLPGALVGLKKVLALDASAPPISNKIILPECSDSITVLKKDSPGSSLVEIVLIGTAHISDESAKLVRRTIQLVSPSFVMIELDPKRVGRFTNTTMLSEAGFDIPSFSRFETQGNRESRGFAGLFSNLLGGIQTTIQRVSGALLGQVLSQFYRSIEKLGFTAGGEFKTAVEEARLLPGTRVLLGDR